MSPQTRSSAATTASGNPQAESTKSRRYSTTLGALRKARAEWRRAQAITSEISEALDTTLVLSHWVYAGTGLTDAETWLAETIAPVPGTEGEPTHA